MSPADRSSKVQADVTGLQVEVRDLGQAVEKNTESLCEVREGFQRLRGELNGVLPRLEENVERLIDHLNGREETDREYFEKVRVHETEIGTLFEQMGKKADAEANREEHGRLWLALRLFFYGTLVALLALLLERVLR